MSAELYNLDWSLVVEKLKSFATSEQARELLKGTQPLPSPEDATKSFDHIIEVVEVLKSGVRPHMESLDLVATWLPRLERKGVLKTIELKDVRFFCIEVLALKEVLVAFRSPFLKEIQDSLFKVDEPLSAIDQLMTPAGDIRTDASEKLFHLTKEKTDLIRKVQNSLERISKDNHLSEVLQERFVTTREGRWVLPVRSGMQHDFKGIIHASSQTKQTVYMEPQEVIPFNNRLREIEIEIEAEIERLLNELSAYLATLAFHFKVAKERMLEMDQLFAKGHLAQRMSASPCTFKDDIKLRDLRHPLLVFQNPDVVPNTVELDQSRRILLLSGPNAGGKTVLLKSIGLAAQMARCGLLICASNGSQLPFFKNLHVGIGDAQSVDAHLSTFAAHLKTLNAALQANGPQDLILIDEICGSTDPEEGSALAKSFIQHYAGLGCFAVITSHLAALKSGWPKDSGVMFGSMEFDAKEGPTYQLLMGIPGQSLAIQTAQRVGVTRSVIDKALTFLSPEHRKYEESLSEIETVKTQIRELKTQLFKDQAQAQKAKQEFEKKSKELEEKKDQILTQALKDAEKKVDSMIETARAQETFKKFENMQKIKMDLPEIVKAPQKLETQIQSAQDFEKAFPPGSKIYIASLGRDGVIQGTPNAKGDVSVLSESMRLLIPWHQLKMPNQMGNPTREVLRRSRTSVSNALSEDRTIDLRGRTVEEAIEHLEGEFDTATLNQEDRIKIVHGVGTEALKKGIRVFLSRSLYVKKWYAGQPETGGEGVTWVELQD